MRLKKQEVFQLVGKSFGRLKVVEVVQLPSKCFKYQLKCQCECGNIKYYTAGDLKKSLSCGCLRKEKWNKAYHTWIKTQKMYY